MDQGVRAALQREVPRRQVLPVPRDHDERGVPPGVGDARGEAQGGQVLRPVCASLGDTRDRGPTPARLPCAHVQQRGVQALCSDGTALSVGLHRQVQRPVRRPDLAGGPPRTRRGSCVLPGHRHGTVHEGPGTPDARGVGGAGLRDGGSPARRPRCPAQSDGAHGAGAPGDHQRRRDRPRGGRTRSGLPGLPCARGPGAWPARLRGGEGGR